MRKLYFCIGCRQVHYDNDYSESDGDLIITDWDKFFKSVNDHGHRRNKDAECKEEVIK